MDNKENKKTAIGQIIEEAATIIKRGGIVAAATETFFAILADVYNQEAVSRVKKIKEIKDNFPMLVLAPSLDEVSKLVQSIPPHAQKLINNYWPGALTLIFNARMTCPNYITGFNNTIAIRIPGICDAAEIIRLTKRPLTGTSCNIHGKTPAITGRMVTEEFGNKIDLVVPGECPGGLPSTIIDVTVNPPVIRRRGIVNVEGKFLK